MSRAHGAFVYQGSGKKQPEDAPPEQKLCKKQACAIQWCLAKRNHKEIYCKAEIDSWKECVDKVKSKVEFK